MRVREDKSWVTIALMGGFAEVENDEVTILVNSAERGDSIDLEEARTAFTESESALASARNSGERQGLIQATQAYKRARARFQAAGGMA
jgi:F-type H+-transporting ATPase subunit epsilon